MGKREDDLLRIMRVAGATQSRCRKSYTPTWWRAVEQYNKARTELCEIRENRLRRVKVAVTEAKRAGGPGSKMGECKCNHSLNKHPGLNGCMAINKRDGLLCKCLSFRMRG